MARLVDVVRGAGGVQKECARRARSGDCEVPLVIDDQLTLTLALEETEDSLTSKPDLEAFRKSYRSLTSAEVERSLKVSTSDVTRTASTMVSCLGCRKAVESLHQDIAKHGNNMGPFTISSSGEVSVAREHREVTRLANILSSEPGAAALEQGGGRKAKARGRCPLHSLDNKKSANSVNWGPTWECMDKKVQEEVVLLPFLSVRKTLDGYLKRHKFCSDCSFMLNRAYFFLMSEGEMKVSTDTGCPSQKLLDDFVHLFPGISACPLVKYIYVESDRDFLTDLYNVIEPELSGLSDTRHAKTLELAQREIVKVIGLTLFERFRKIQQRLEETEQTYSLLKLTLVKTLRTSFDLTADKKRGDQDFELLCQELEMDEKKEEKRKEKKKEKKKNKRAKKREANSECLIDLNCQDEVIGENEGKSISQCSKVEEDDIGDSETASRLEDVDDLELVGDEYEESEVTEETPCSVFCERDHTNIGESREECGIARKVETGWLTSQALSASKTKRKSTKQKTVSGDSGFSSAESSLNIGKLTLSNDCPGEAECSGELEWREAEEASCSVFCERDHSESTGASKEDCGNASRKVGKGWLISDALSATSAPKNKRKATKQKAVSSIGDSGFSSAESSRYRKHSLSIESSGEGEGGGEIERRDTGRDNTCSVFCKLGMSEEVQEEDFSHTVCLAEWLTAQYVQNPDIDLFSAFFLGVNF